MARRLNPLRFEPGSDAPRKQVGAGMIMARAIAEAHGGRLEIRSAIGQGCTAMLTLPPERVVLEPGRRGR